MQQVFVRQLPRQPTFVVRGRVAVEDIGQWLGPVFHRTAAAAGSSIVGPPFARYHMVGEAPTEFEVEAGFPVAVAGTAENGVETSELPGGPALVVTHIGPFDEIASAYEAVTEWLAEHGDETAGAPWEVYLTDPAQEPDPARWRTEIVQPYRPKEAGS